MKNEKNVTYKVSDDGWKNLYNNSKFLLGKQLNDFSKKEVSLEDIKSSYDSNGYFICPIGFYPIIQYKDGNLYEIKPFDLSGNWEIYCFIKIIWINCFLLI